MRFSARISGLALALALAPAAHAQDEAPTAETVVATVDGTDITLGELIIARSQLPQQYQQLPPEVLFEGLVDQLVQQQLLSDLLDQVPTALELRLRNEERSLRAGEAITDITDEAVTEEALRAAYEAQYGDAEPTREYNASHILVETEEEAQQLVQEARGGADFAELAREHSTGPSGPQGGDLGWFEPGAMVQPFAEAVTALEPGEISDPVQTQFGWHVIKLDDTRLSEGPAFEDVRQELQAQVQQQAIQDRLAALEQEADITRPEPGEFDPALLGDMDLLRN